MKTLVKARQGVQQVGKVKFALILNIIKVAANSKLYCIIVQGHLYECNLFRFFLFYFLSGYNQNSYEQKHVWKSFHSLKN